MSCQVVSKAQLNPSPHLAGANTFPTIPVVEESYGKCEYVCLHSSRDKTTAILWDRPLSGMEHGTCTSNSINAHPLPGCSGCCASKKAIHLCGDVEEPRLILSFQSEYRFRWFCLRKSSFCCRRVSSIKPWSRRGITWNRVATVQAWMSPDAR